MRIARATGRIAKDAIIAFACSPNLQHKAASEKYPMDRPSSDAAKNTVKLIPDTPLVTVTSLYGSGVIVANKIHSMPALLNWEVKLLNSSVDP